ncbi:hypothetical protein [Streptomyces sp. H27-D2]|nr:hypothetical protein [Streptomyces sp. H27-D2]MEC4016532.1 hypothetical protein [Streptomyces sp. H27-D2]
MRLCADSWGGYALGDEVFGAAGKPLWFELARPGAGLAGTGAFDVAA